MQGCRWVDAAERRSRGKAEWPSPRLVRAAHEFEAQMMKELLKPMTGSDALTGAEDGDSDSGAGSGGALGEFASEALGAGAERAGRIWHCRPDCERTLPFW